MFQPTHHHQEIEDDSELKEDRYKFKYKFKFNLNEHNTITACKLYTYKETIDMDLQNLKKCYAIEVEGDIDGISFQQFLENLFYTRQTTHKKFFRLIWLMVKVIVSKIKFARKPTTNSFYYSVIGGNIKKFAELLTDEELLQLLEELEKEAFKKRV